MSVHEHEPLLKLEGLDRSFTQGTRTITVLDKACAELNGGEAVALVGPSGAGKSSLLHIVGLLEAPNAGQVILGGRNCVDLPDQERTRIRRNDIGFVYQFHHLLPEFSALENVVLPQLLTGKPEAKAEERARELLDGLELGDRVEHRPAELSGGEQQRVAIARALANAPRILLADEPTGNLDPPTAQRVFDQLITLIRGSSLGALIATHNMELAGRMDRILRLEDGKLIDMWADEPG